MLPCCFGLIFVLFCYTAPILVFVIFSCAKKKKRMKSDKSEITADYEWIYLPVNAPVEFSRSDEKGQTGTDTMFKNTQLLQTRIGSGDQGVQVHSDEPRGSHKPKPTHTPTPTPIPQPKPKAPEQANKQPGKQTTYGLLFEEEGQRDFREILCNNKTPIRKNVKKPDKLQEIPAYICPAKTMYGFPLDEPIPKPQRQEHKVIDQHLQMIRTHPPRHARNRKQAAPLQDSPLAPVKKKTHPEDVYGMKSHSDRAKPIAPAGSDVFGMMEDSLKRPIERPKKKKKS